MSGGGVKIIRIHEPLPPQREQLPGFEDADIAKDATPLEAFEAFHKANPWVYDDLVHRARILVAAQRRRGAKVRIGIKLLVENLRFDWEVRTTSVDGFKINNNHTAFYARRIMANEPDLADVFETRVARADVE